MISDLLTGNIPVLFVLCIVVYIIYMLHKRIIRLEGVFKKVNEINATLIQLLEKNTGGQKQLPSTPEVSQQQFEVPPQQPDVPVQRQPQMTNPLMNMMSGLTGLLGGLGMNSQPSVSKIEEINEESSEEETEHPEIEQDDGEVEDISSDSEDEEVPVEDKVHYHEDSTPQESENESDNKSGSSIAEYSEESLSKLNVKELHDIAHKLHITLSKKNENGKQSQKTKKELITEILNSGN